MTCIACNHIHEERFCPNCGEKSQVVPITFKSIINSFFSGVLNMDKGFLYNLKYLTIRPKEVIQGYIKGKRKGIYNPLSYLFMTIIVFLVIDSLLPHATTEMIENPSEVRKMGREAGKFVGAYFKYFWLTSIIWLSLVTKFFYRKNNLAEHLTINSFIIGHATLFSLIGLLLFRWIILFNPIIYLVIGYMLFVVHSENGKVSDNIISSIASIFFYIVLLFLILLLIGYIRTL